MTALLAVLATSALTMGSLAFPTLAVAAAPTPPPLYIVMDVSGSMADSATGSQLSKLDQAKTAAYQLVNDLPRNQTVTFVTYPGGGTTIEGCNVGDVRFGPARADPATLSAKIRGLRAQGGTPTGPALQHVKGLFANSGATKGTVVLISDGESNCGQTDVCEVARNLNDAGLSLTVNTVGFDINDTGQNELSCVAAATGGKSVTVADGGDLLGALEMAARAKLEAKVAAPSAVTAVTGVRVLGASENAITVAVRSVGAERARNVRVALLVTDGRAQSGSVYAAQPIRYLGNLGGAVPESTQTFAIKPTPETVSPVHWTVKVMADNAVTSEQAGEIPITTSTSLSTAGPLLTEARQVVVMGDSYSSGEGAGDYDRAEQKDSDEYACHRSSHAYGRLLFSADTSGTTGTGVALIACSGATTVDLRQHQHPDIAPQLDRLRELARRADPPDLVLMTLGGNDAGFVDFITGCVIGGVLWDPGWSLQVHPCGADPDYVSGEDMAPYFVSSRLASDLRSGYAAIDSILNAPQVVARRGGRQAQIVVLPYVNPLPPAAQLRESCLSGLSELEASVASTFLERLNTAVAAATRSAHLAGVPIHYAADVEGALQNGHTICDPGRAMATDVIARKATDLLPVLDTQLAQEAVHPNATGQRLIAQSLIEWSRGAKVDWTMRTTPVTPDLAGTSVAATFSALGANLGQLLTGTVEAGTALQGGCTDHLSTSDCASLRQADLTAIHIQSEPRYLRTALPRDGQDPLAGLHIPADLPPGSHTLVIRALTVDGKPAVYRAKIQVSRPGTGSSMLLCVLGGALALTGLSWWIIARRRPSTRKG